MVFDPNMLVELVRLSRKVLMFNLSTAVIVFYQYLVNLSDEITYIWPAPWNVGKILYFLIRYSVFLDLSILLTTASFEWTPAQCKGLVLAQEWLFIIGVGFVAIVLSLRAWIIWLQNRTIVYLLGPLFLLCWAAMIYLATSASINLSIPPSPVSLPGCFLGIQKKNYIDFFIVSVLITGFEMIVIALTWARMIRDRKRGLSKPQSPVIAVLYRDAQLVHIYPMLFSNILFLIINRVPVFLILLGFQRAFHSIFASKALLRLRMANETRLSETEQKRALSKLVSMQFRSRRGERNVQDSNATQRTFIGDLRNDVEDWFASDIHVSSGTGSPDESLTSEDHGIQSEHSTTS